MSNLAFIFLLWAQAVNPAPALPPAPGVYYRLGDQQWQTLAPASIQDMKSKGIDVFLETDGFSDLDITVTYRGAEAPVQIRDARPTFYVRGTGTAKDAMIILLSRKGDARTLRTSSVDASVNNKGGFRKETIRHVTTAACGEDSFSVTPDQDLKPGEYLLVFGYANHAFDFGIRQKSGR